MLKLQTPDEQEGSLRDLAPDLTPMIDVMFILLLFLILSMGLQYQAVSIDLIGDDNSTTVEIKEKQMVIEVTSGNALYKIDGNELNLQAAKEKILQIKQAEPDTAFTVAPDKEANIQDFVKIISFLRANKINTADILLQGEQK